MRKYSLTKLEDIAALGPNIVVLGDLDTGNPDDEEETTLLGIDADAPGAWPRGTRVVKAWNQPGDTHDLGAKATVRGSVLPKDYPVKVDLEPGEIMYCVEWDDLPGKPIFCRGKKLALEKPGASAE